MTLPNHSEQYRGNGTCEVCGRGLFKGTRYCSQSCANEVSRMSSRFEPTPNEIAAECAKIHLKRKFREDEVPPVIFTDQPDPVYGPTF